VRWFDGQAWTEHVMPEPLHKTRTNPLVTTVPTTADDALP
jgi:hypothetical protein